MSVGSRVVRGPDWAGGNQDSGEGGLGTVISENVDNGKVKVIWDTGLDGHYRAGYDGRFELRIYDNAPTGSVHVDVTCDICRISPIQGMRWKCATCTDFDLCSLCYMSGKHDISHPFLLHEKETSTLVPVDSRKMLKKEYIHGILPGASVMRGIHWKWGNQDGGSQVGKVTKVVTWGKTSYRGGMNVTWNNGRKNAYRCGAEGCVDLILIAESEVISYFPQHLPALDVKNQSKSVLKRGDKVRVDIAMATVKKLLSESFISWHDKIKEYLSQLGTVVELINTRIVRVQYEDAQEWSLFTALLTKVHSFSPGNVVRILPNINAVKELQRGHGGWGDQMEYTVGSLGVVEEIDDDDDFKVKVDQFSWIFSPVCCQYVEEESLTDPERAEIQQIKPELKKKKATPPPSPQSSEEDLGNDLAKLLLKIITQEPDEDHITPQGLIESAAQADLTGVQEVVKAKPNLVNQAVDGTTALQMASFKGHVEIVAFLLKSKADIDFTDKEGDTSLHFAIFEKHLDVVDLLVKHGADVDVKNNKGFTPCHLAVNVDLVVVVQTLLKRDCDVNTQDNDGDTPLHDALKNEEIAKTLLNNKTTKFDIYNDNGLLAFHQAVMDNKEKLVQIILEKQPSIIKLRSQAGEFTALHIAVANGFVSLVNLLINKGKADVNAREGSMKTSLHLAVMKRSVVLVDILLFHNSDIDAVDVDGNTPSHLAQMTSTLATTMSISTTRAQMEVDHDTPIDIPYMLAQAGPDFSIKNKEGKTPTDLIKIKDTAKMLVKIANDVKKTSTTKKTKTAQDKDKDDLDPPKYWTPMQNKQLVRVEMKPTEQLTSEEYSKISGAFQRTLGNKTIIKIERIQNLSRWEHFAFKKKTMEKVYGRGLADERLLFHGTKPDVVDSIVGQGIDFRLVERALYGDGAYFGSDAKISDYYTHPDSQGHRFMFVVRVLVGKYTRGQQGWKKPPAVSDSKPHISYDSVVNNPDNPQIFVIFDNTQCYTEYIIEYN